MIELVYNILSDVRQDVIDGVNHILKEVPLNRKGNLATYQNPELQASTRAIDVISSFILQ